MPYVYDYFCDLVEANHPLVLGENNLNLPRIFEIILYTFSHGVFDEECDELKAVKERLVRIMHMIKVRAISEWNADYFFVDLAFRRFFFENEFLDAKNWNFFGSSMFMLISVKKSRIRKLE